MNNKGSNIITLFNQIKINSTIEVQVDGTSMEPTMISGDVVSIQPQEAYLPGDVIVFIYKNNCLLIHRLLKIRNNRYFCKGDNSFRLEDISFDQILGKATYVNGILLKPWQSELIDLSYMVNRTFRNSKYNVDKTKESGIYRFYNKYINRQSQEGMLFKANPNLNYIPNGSSLVIVNPQTRESHLFDKKSLFFFECLAETCEFNHLVVILRKHYKYTKKDNLNIVEDFLAETITKHLVYVL